MSLRQQRILIVDEINYTRLALAYTLTRLKYKVSTTRNGNEAMQSISAELPDLILFSIRTNDPSNILMLRALKDYFRLRLDIAQGAEPPIIVLSAFKDDKQSMEIQSLGISRILSKPVNMQELEDAVKLSISDRKKVIPQVRKKIVILDVETRSQQFIKSILAHEIYDIDTADSKSEFLARLKHKNFDLLILDLASFDDSIIETIQQIKVIDNQMPIITIASYADRLSQDNIDKLGIQAHFVRPLNIDIFRTTIDTILKAEVVMTEDQLSTVEVEKQLDGKTTNASEEMKS